MTPPLVMAGLVPVKQTVTGEGRGNCMAACIATILGCPLEDVPNPHTPDWMDQLLTWAGERGLAIEWEYREEDVPAGVPCVLATQWNGNPARSRKGHSVVWLSGQVVHDPHPIPEPLGEPVFWMWFEAAP